MRKGATYLLAQLGFDLGDLAEQLLHLVVVEAGGKPSSLKRPEATS